MLKVVIKLKVKNPHCSIRVEANEIPRPRQRNPKSKSSN
jgi:hypothetical protein